MKDLNILIAGCGFLGEALADAFHEQGASVTGLTHSSSSAARLEAEKPWPAVSADLSSRDSVNALEIESPDLMVHCASSGRGGADQYRRVYRDGCRWLMERWPEATLLFTSSTSVYPQTGGEIVTEESDANPDRETGQVLRETEDLVLAENGIVVRLAGIYGPGRSVILQRFLNGSAIIEEGESRHLNQIHRTDIVGALLMILEKRAGTRGQIYNITDGNPMTQRNCYEALSLYFDQSLPPEGPRDLNRKRGWTNKILDNGKVRALGWKARYPTFMDAVKNDPELIPSVKAKVDAAA